MTLSFNTENFNLKAAWPDISLVIMTICCASGVIISHSDKNYSALTANIITYLWVLNWYFSIKTTQKLEKINTSYEKLLFDILAMAKENSTNQPKN